MEFLKDMFEDTGSQFLNCLSLDQLPIGYLIHFWEMRGFVYVLLAFGGTLLCLLASAFILSPLFRNFPQRGQVLFCATWPVILSDLSVALRTLSADPMLIVHVFVPLVICAAIVSRSLFRSGAGTPRHCWRRKAVLAGILLAHVWIGISIGYTTNWHGAMFSKVNIWCGVPFLHLGYFFYPPNYRDEFTVLFVGELLCIVLVFVLMSPLFKRCLYRKTTLLNMAWAVYLFELSGGFWVRGYYVWSFLYLFLPLMVGICISLWLLFRSVADKRVTEHRWRFFSITLIGLLAQLWSLFVIWIASNYNAFGASC